MADPAPEILTVAEAAELLEVHPDTVVRWADQGRLVQLPRFGRGWRRFRRSDVERLLEPEPEGAAS